MIEYSLIERLLLMSNHQNKAKFFTRGGQITFHNWRMLFQINKQVSKYYIICFFITLTLTVILITPSEIYHAAYYWLHSKIIYKLSFLGIQGHAFIIHYHGKAYLETARSFLSQKPLIDQAVKILAYLKLSAVIAAFISLCVSIIMVKWLIRRGQKQTENQYIRGAVLGTSKQVTKRIYKDHKASDIHIDDFPMIKNAEVKHTLVHGTTGSGKGQLISKFLDHLRKRGDRVILYDKGCSFTPVYYRTDSDIMLNPFDQRCVNWDLWSEARDAPDFENMAESLIPSHGEHDPFWINAARTIFASAAWTMQNDSDRSITKLLKLILTAEMSDLETYLKGTDASILTSDKIEKTALSIKSVLTTYLKSLRYLQGLNRPDLKKFSIYDWVLDDQRSDWLFISSNAEQHTTLKPLISMWLAMASIALLSLPPDYNRRIWFVVDELPSLHRIPQLPETIAEVRKFGGCFVLGMQSFAQLEKVYGRHGARELFDLMNTRFFFRSASSDMARLVSQELGEQEVEDMRENYSYGANRIRDGISIGHQRLTRPIVSYSEIMNMEDLHCYLRLPSNYPVVPLELKFENRTNVIAPFIRRNIKRDTEIEALIKKNECQGVKGFKASKLDNTDQNNKTLLSTQSNKVKKDKNAFIQDFEINAPNQIILDD